MSNTRTETSATKSRTLRTMVAMEQAHKEQIGQRVGEKRRLRGYTQEEFAELMGVSVRSVQQWEAGETTPLRRLDKMASLLETTVEWILGGDRPAVEVETIEQLRADIREVYELVRRLATGEDGEHGPQVD